MTGDEMALRKRFCKDMGLPLTVVRSPYFEDRLNLFGAENDWIWFTDVVESRFDGSIHDFLSTYNQAIEAFLSYVRESDTWNAMQNDPDVLMKNPPICGQRNLYSEANVGDEFLSIDMRKANFSALVCYGLATGNPFHKNYDYDAFIQKIADPRIADVIAKSKHVRQVVFGKCNSKRQISYEKWLMNTLAEQLIVNGLIRKEDLFSINSDEILLSGNFSKEKVRELKHSVDTWSDIFVPTRMEWFKIERLDGTDAYLKAYVHSGGILGDQPMIPAIKCVGPIEAPFVYRFLKKEPFKESDSVFLLDGRRLASLMDIPNISLRKEKSLPNKEKETEEDLELS